MKNCSPGVIGGRVLAAFKLSASEPDPAWRTQRARWEGRVQRCAEVGDAWRGQSPTQDGAHTPGREVSWGAFWICFRTNKHKTDAASWILSDGWSSEWLLHFACLSLTYQLTFHLSFELALHTHSYIIFADGLYLEILKLMFKIHYYACKYSS